MLEPYERHPGFFSVKLLQWFSVLWEKSHSGGTQQSHSTVQLQQMLKLLLLKTSGLPDSSSPALSPIPDNLSLQVPSSGILRNDVPTSPPAKLTSTNIYFYLRSTTSNSSLFF
ncbi:uncharacterized [Tachysurus ichikawai]